MCARSGGVIGVGKLRLGRCEGMIGEGREDGEVLIEWFLLFGTRGFTSSIPES